MLSLREIFPLTNKKERREFIQVPFNLYQSEKNWVPPLKASVSELLSKKHPVWETSTIRAWIVSKDNKNVGRIAAIVNHAHTNLHQDSCGFFGFYESTQEKEISDLLIESAQKALSEAGCKLMRGPLNPSTNYECGLLVEGYNDPPQVMMTYNPKFYQEQLENKGFQKAKDLLAWEIIFEGLELPDTINKIAARTEKKDQITYRTINKKNWNHEVALMLEIYNDAWEKNWGFVPMSSEEFIHTANDLKMVVDEKLLLFAEVAGEPAGFIVCLPDLNQAFHKNKKGALIPGLFHLMTSKKRIDRMRIITLGVKSKFRKRGLETLLYRKCLDNIQQNGQYKTGELSWILEDNLPMNKPIERMGAEVYKRYRIYEKTL